jgi:DNA-binding FadR family transcriptional regulator
VAADVALHRAIGHAAHNAVLVDLYDNLLDALHDNIAGNMAQGHDDADGHGHLVEAIVAGDGERAAVEAACFLDTLLDGVN